MALKDRERILIVSAIIVIAFWAFVTFYSAPQSRKIRVLRAELKAADLKLDESRLLTKGLENLEAEVFRKEEVLKKLGERTLRRDEFKAFLRHLAKESDSPQMKVVSLIPREENMPSPEGKKENSTSQYRRVAVEMVLHSTFSKLGAYLKGIEGLPFLISVDNIHIERSEEVQPLLKINIGLSMYVVSSS